MNGAIPALVGTLIRPEHLNDPDVFGRFVKRISTGTGRTTMLNEAAGPYPERGLITIGTGGNRCTVTFGSYDPDHFLCKAPEIPKGLESHSEFRTYAHCIDLMATSPENTGFNGYPYYRKGGYPMPEGWELEYADVPYAFKMWMLKEAHLAGFSSCLWMDSVFMANKSVDPIFDIARPGRELERHFERFGLPRSRSEAEKCTGCKIGHTIWARVFGLITGTQLTDDFTRIYDEPVKGRLGFYGCFPEGLVFASLTSLSLDFGTG
ncbi:MAG: hypothetical protein OXF02_06765 [Simkaniaceae bacterium]|nr:hypothetical protein [Simkaniaceae bacterium]